MHPYSSPAEEMKKKILKVKRVGAVIILSPRFAAVEKNLPKICYFYFYCNNFFASGANLHVFKALTFAQKKEKRTNNS